MSTLDDHLPALARAGLTPAVHALEMLARSAEGTDPTRWQGLSDESLLNHLECHVLEIQDDLTRRDEGTGHLTAAHAAARALMTLARALERSR
jgi:hypothetical protein